MDKKDNIRQTKHTVKQCIYNSTVVLLMAEEKILSLVKGICFI